MHIPTRETHAQSPIEFVFVFVCSTPTEQTAHGGLPQSEGGRGRGVHLQEVLQGARVSPGQWAKRCAVYGQRPETQGCPETKIQRRPVSPVPLATQGSTGAFGFSMLLTHLLHTLKDSKSKTKCFPNSLYKQSRRCVLVINMFKVQ